ncbi:hypothetical protein R6Q59_017024 [Mikania micrantha]
MRKLKFLRISNIHFPQGLNYLSNDLRILEWYGCSLKSLPSMFEPKHIYELEMCYSQLETLWVKKLDLPNLRSIDLSFSEDLTKIPDLTSTPNLVKLNLKGCTKLKELNETILSHKTIRFINLSGCRHLHSLGRSNMEMEALVTLILSGCSNLECVPEFGHNMKCLEHLYVDGTKIKKLPESLGELCNLRKLDASETSIQDIPLSIQYLKRLRLLRVHRCQLSSQSRGFLFTKLDMVSSSLKELDLSYCNLSVVPDCIGLLHRLVNLDLSGNDFVFLPANISLLSNLRILCLNNCKRLQSLPKLSIVNEDTLYGLQMRYNYIISQKSVDESKFHATSNNSSPMVACLNCPKLAENERGSYLAERIVNSYLQLRSKYWTTPEAVFEIIGAGSVIPSGFKLLKSNENFTLKGPWIGVVICAVVALHHIDAAIETKYVVTAHIHVGTKNWRIPVPINLVAGLENQLVFYWTTADDLQRIVDPSQKNNFKFSFSMEPQDCNLQVTSFGIRCILEKDIMQLKKLDDSTTKLTRLVFVEADLSLPSERQWYMCAHESVTFIRSCHSSINHDLTRSVKFICDYGKQQYTLDDIHKIHKRLIEINQEVLSECKEEWSHTEIFPLVYDYYQIIHGTSVFYNEFLRLLKDASDSWLSVKKALEQIVVKSRTCTDYSYREMLEQLNDLEAAEGIRFCDNFIASFVFFCKQTVSFSRHFNEHIQDIEKLKTLAKVSCITNACIFSILATYLCTDKLSQEMKDGSSYSTWLHLIRSFLKKSDELFPPAGSYERELRIQDFSGIAVVVQKLKMTMARFASFTCQSEKEMMMAINKLEKMMDSISLTIKDMHMHAHQYNLDIRVAGSTLNQFIIDGNLHFSVTGVRFMPPNEEQQFENSMHEAMVILYQATLSLILTDLQWYIRACEEEVNDSSLLSFHTIIHDNIHSIIKIICGLHPIGEVENSLHDVHRVIACLHAINQEGFTVLSECKEEWRHQPQLFHLVNDYHKICLQTSQLYNDFVRLLKSQSDSWSSVMLRWKELQVKYRQDKNYWEFKIKSVLLLNDVGKFSLSGDFMKRLAYICKQTVAFTRQFDEEIQNLKSVKVLAKVSSGLITGILSLIAEYVVGHLPCQPMAHQPLTCVWLHLIQNFSLKTMNHIWKGEQLAIKDLFYDDFYLKLHRYTTSTPTHFTIDSFEQTFNKKLVTVEEMSRHAHKCSVDIIKAGKTLELISHNHMLPVKRTD